MSRVVFASLTILFLLSVSSVTGLIHLAKADSGTIYIQADGSINPSTAPIYTADNITYTLTGNITVYGSGIVIERDNITVDGQGYTVQGAGRGIVSGTGITLSERSNVTIENMTIGAFDFGIWLWSSSGNIISGNNITNNGEGILLAHSSDYNSISGNNITDNTVGIYLNSSSNDIISGNNITANYNLGITLYSSSNNSISGNNITNNGFGISCHSSSDYNTISGNTVANNGFGILQGVGIYLISSNDTIYHNNFMNNTNQLYSSGSPNVWDNGFEGNYWSDYNGTDNNQDGIADTPYIIDENNTDHYPLMGHFESFNVSTWSQPNDVFEEVYVTSNFTISDLGLYAWLTTPNQYLQAGQLFLRIVPVQEQNMTAGFCRMTLPRNILNTSDYIVLTDMTNIRVNKLAISNNTHTTLYFTFNISANEEIIIVPEFPSFLILPLLFMATLLTIIFCRKKLTRTA